VYPDSGVKVTTMNQAPAFDQIDPQHLGERLQLARKAKSLTQEAVAEHLDVARTTLVAIEKGERRIRPSELFQLAELYERDPQELLAQQRPENDLSVQFRSLLKKMRDNEDREILQAATARLQDDAERFVELETILKRTPRPQYPRQHDLEGIHDIEQIAEAAADEERRRLGLGDAPIFNLRETLEDHVGIRIFYVKLDSKIGGLYGYAEGLGACIAINSSHPLERQNMTLAHEYGHILERLDRPDIEVEREQSRQTTSERFADLFARRFLMPAMGVKRQIRAHMQASGITTLNPRDWVMLACRAGISFEAYMRRVEELKIIPGGYYERLMAENFKVQEAQRLLNLSSILPAQSRFPRRYTLMALEAYAKNLISGGELARYLDTDALSVREQLEQYLFEMEAQVRL
jgi:Zn-dependent peptidase ImmA (M78 family)/DNA-binding XRE family transcriptional regulator